MRDHGWWFRVHGWCLKAFPADFRAQHGDDMVATFAERRGAATVRGRWSGWGHALAECTDVLLSGLRYRLADLFAGGSGRPAGTGTTLRVIRVLRRRPMWTASIVITLGLGIGASTAVFSLVDHVAIRSLPYAEPDLLLRIGGVREGRAGLSTVSGPNFRDLAGSVETLSAVAGSTPGGMSVRASSGPSEVVRGGYVSGAFFRLLGVDAVRGRVLSDEDDRPGAPLTVVISHSFWESRMGADDVVGRTLTIGGAPVTIVGVTGPDFHPPEGAHMGGTLLWMPLAHSPLPVRERGLSLLDVIGRIAPGSSPEAASRELELLGTALAEAHGMPGRQFLTFAASPLRMETVGAARRSLLLLLGAVSFLFLIACANVTNLLLVRTAQRRSELATLVALGATRWSLMRQSLLESAVLAGGGAALGIAIAYGAVGAVVGAGPISLPRLAEVEVDGRVLLFTLALAAAVALVVGVVPALHAARSVDSSPLGTRGGTPGKREGSLRDLVVVSQGAIGLVLLVGAGLLINSFVRMQRVDPGFDPHGITVLSLKWDAPGGGEPAPLDVSSVAALIEGTRAIPEALSASATTGAPFTSGGWLTYADPEGVDIPPEELSRMQVGLHQTSPEHLTLLGAHFVAGRDLGPGDGADAEPVIVISESLAREFWPDGDALGRRVVVGGDGTFTPRTIVGVVRAPAYTSPAAGQIHHLYLPLEQFPPTEVDLVVRAGGDHSGIAGALRDLIVSVDPSIAVRRLDRMEDAMGRERVEPGFYAMLLLGFAAIAILLTAVGLYATLAFALGERKREMGIRLALGARRGELVRSLVGRGLAIVGLGVAIGLTAALGASRVLESFVFGITPSDPVTYATMTALLFIVGAVASYLPTRDIEEGRLAEILRED